MRKYKQNALEKRLPKKPKAKAKNKCGWKRKRATPEIDVSELKTKVMRIARITSIVSLCWPGEIAPPKLKPHSRFVVFNQTTVAFPLLEITKLSTQAY